MSPGVRLNKRIVAGLLDLSGNFGNCLIPRDVFPVGAAGAAHLWLQQSPVVQNILLQRGAFGAERAAIDGMVRIAFDVNDLRGDILRTVANRVDDHATADRTVGTRRARFIGSSYF